jgi:nicotinamide riboside kinase
VVVKIAIVGTYSCGKTTLADQLLRRFPSTHLLPEHARRSISVGGIEAIRMRETRDFLLVSNLLDEAEIDVTSRLAVSDSGLINNLAHEALFFDPPPDRSSVLAAYRHRAYDAVLWCDPAGVPLTDDGQRIIDIELRTQLHNCVGSVMKNMGIAPIEICGSMTNRIEVAATIVERLLEADGAGPC